MHIIYIAAITVFLSLKSSQADHFDDVVPWLVKSVYVGCDECLFGIWHGISGSGTYHLNTCSSKFGGPCPGDMTSCILSNVDVPQALTEFTLADQEWTLGADEELVFGSKFLCGGEHCCGQFEFYIIDTTTGELAGSEAEAYGSIFNCLENIRDLVCNEDGCGGGTLASYLMESAGLITPEPTTAPSRSTKAPTAAPSPLTKAPTTGPTRDSGSEDNIAAIFEENKQLDNDVGNSDNDYNDGSTSTTSFVSLHFSDVTLVNMWVLFGILMIVNIIFCMCTKRKRGAAKIVEESSSVDNIHI